MNYEFARLFGGSRWMIEPNAFRSLLKRAEAVSAEAIQAAMKAYSDRPPTPPAPIIVGDVGVINVNGPIIYRASWISELFGFAAIETLRAKFRAALADQDVKTIVFRGETPGGIIDMVPEFADEIYAARGQKPMIAVADTYVASCGYWLLSQCDKIIVPRSGSIGAVGTYFAHENIAGMLEKMGIKITLISHGENKTEGNPYEAPSEGYKTHLQGQADIVGGDFDQAAARGRGVSKKVVLDTFGQGRLYLGREAVALGLADAVGTFEQLMSKLTKGRTASVGMRGDALVEAGRLHLALAAVPGLTLQGRAETMEPEDGECQEGYELRDGTCHLVEEEAEAEASTIAPKPLAGDPPSGPCVCSHEEIQHAETAMGWSGGACLAEGCDCGAWTKPEAAIVADDAQIQADVDAAAAAAAIAESL